MTLKFTVPLPPVTKKNSQRILINSRTGARFIAPSAKYADYERAAAPYVPRRREPIDRPVSVKCVFYMPTARACDLTNCLEAIDDVMVAAGLLKDDSYRIIASHDGSRVCVDAAAPRTEVEIAEYTEA